MALHKINLFSKLKEKPFRRKSIASTVVIMVVIIGVIVINHFVLLGQKNKLVLQSNVLVKQADTLMISKNYDKATSIYEQALAKSSIPSIQVKLSNAKKLQSSKKGYIYGMKYFNEKDYESSITAFGSVIKEDSVNYKIAIQKISESKKLCIPDLINKAEQSAYTKNYDAASTYMSTALSFDSTNKQISNLLAKYQTSASLEAHKYDSVEANTAYLKEQSELPVAEQRAEDVAAIARQRTYDANAIADQNTRDEQVKSAKTKAKTVGVTIGMTEQECLDSSWGKPDQVNKTTLASGTNEQWVYGYNSPKMSFLYFDNRILTSIQN